MAWAGYIFIPLVCLWFCCWNCIPTADGNWKYLNPPKKSWELGGPGHLETPGCALCSGNPPYRDDLCRLTVGGAVIHHSLVLLSPSSRSNKQTKPNHHRKLPEISSVTKAAIPCFLSSAAPPLAHEGQVNGTTCR